MYAHFFHTLLGAGRRPAQSTRASLSGLALVDQLDGLLCDGELAAHDIHEAAHNGKSQTIAGEFRLAGLPLLGELALASRLRAAVSLMPSVLATLALLCPSR